MVTDESFSYLKANTVLFAQKVCGSIADMCDARFTVRKETLREGTFSTPFRIIIFAGFSGTIQGNYIISLDEPVARKLVGCGGDDGSTVSQAEVRKNYSGLLMESLNSAVGQAIEELGRSFRNLAYAPATAVFGEIDFPPVLSADIVIEGVAGKILCGFSLNLATLKIGKHLEKTLNELEQRVNQRDEYIETAEKVLAHLSTGFFCIDENGCILPGFSSTIVSLLGGIPSDDVSGSSLPDIIHIPDSLRPDWTRLLKRMFEGKGLLPDTVSQENSDLTEFTNSCGQRMKLSWHPVIDGGAGTPTRILVILEIRPIC